jgi:hypothetical protein
MVLKVLSGFKLKKDLTSVDLTYIITIAGITCVADTATTVPCTATLSVYIRWYSCFNCTDTSDDTTALTNLTTPTLGNTTATVNAASSGSGDGSGSGDLDDEDGSKFMGISFLLFLFCFYFK